MPYLVFISHIYPWLCQAKRGNCCTPSSVYLCCPTFTHGYVKTKGTLAIPLVFIYVVLHLPLAYILWDRLIRLLWLHVWLRLLSHGIRRLLRWWLILLVVWWIAHSSNLKYIINVNVHIMDITHSLAYFWHKFV